MEFTLTPPDGYRNVTSFPTKPANEAQFRDEMMSIPDQLLGFLNGGNVMTKGNSPLTGSTMVLANGWIVQWGYVTLASGGVVTLPITYPNTFLGAWPIRDSTTAAKYSITDYNTSSFKVWNDIGTTTFFYISIGR